MIRVLLADDQSLVRAGFRLILRAEPDIEVVAEAATGREAVAAAREFHPDVVLMDVQMPDMDGIEATARILADHRDLPENARALSAQTARPEATSQAQAPLPRVLILTTFDLDDVVYGALRAGASGFLLKDAPERQLITAIHVIADGGSLFAPSVTRRLVARFADQSTGRRPEQLAVLTDREREVLTLVANGLSNREIGEKVYITENTVKTHVAHILAKLDLRDRVQAVVLAYETGLVTPLTH